MLNEKLETYIWQSSISVSSHIDQVHPSKILAQRNLLMQTLTRHVLETVIDLHLFFGFQNLMDCEEKFAIRPRSEII